MADNIIRDLRGFLVGLTDEYGFEIDVARLGTCLACFDDVTDLEEVLYRLQSLVCRDDEQIERFRSLFAQRFLRAYITTEQMKKDAPEDRIRDIQRDIRRITRNMQDKEERSVLLKERITQIRRDVERAEKSVKKDREDLRTREEQAKNALSMTIALPTPAKAAARDPKIRERMEKLMKMAYKSIDEAQKLIDAIPGEKDDATLDTIKEHMKSYMSSPDAEARCKSDVRAVLDMASRLHEHNDAFKSALQVTKDLNALSRAFASAVGAKTLREAERISRATKSAEEGFVKERGRIDEKLAKINKDRTALERMTGDIEDMRKSIEEADKRLSALSEERELTIKERSRSHRDIFTAKNAGAVQTTADIEELLSSPVTRMSSAQLGQILSYIRTNARVFRQTLRKKFAAPVKRRVDMRRTMREAARTGGEPMRLRYKQPVKSHAKVVCLVDISGSCRKAASLALYFMAMMDEAFPGGCRKFAFVDRLVPVDAFFKDASAENGVNAVNANVKSKGVYSNYGRTIKTLREDYAGLFNKDTTVIVLGDARNNKNESAASDLAYIASRCKRVFWLDPDEPEEWDEGDSVIGEYIKAGVEAHHVATVKDLLGFLAGAGGVR